MTIQLDWQIQADQQTQHDQEDPATKQKRRRARWRLLVAGLLVAVVVCVGAAALIWRWQQVQTRRESDLRAAVEAEYAAIRLGNQSAFMNLQRSASDPWMEGQRNTFAEYQTLKQNGRFAPDVEVLDLVIDQQRGRVIVQETIDGTPYQQAWFYWKYDTLDAEDTQAGWRHVPPDVTFWGAESTQDNPHSSVTYSELDAFIAEPLAQRMEAWWGGGCALLGCATAPPKLEIIIDPQAGLRLAWEPDTGWRLRVLSPLLAGRVPVAQPVPPALERELATVLAGRLIAYATDSRLVFPAEAPPLLSHDTTWLKYQLRDWLVAQFLGGEAPFVDSLNAASGTSAASLLLPTLADGGQIDVIAPLFGANTLPEVDAARLNQVDWGVFFAWRFALERQRLAANDLDNFFALYELGAFNQVADARAFDANYRASPPETVQQVAFTYRSDGTLAALVDVIDAGGGQSQVTFTWTGDTFIRVN